MKWNFEGKAAIVTGGASGIGYKIAEDMAISGASVAIFDVQDELGNESVKKLEAAGPGNAMFVKVSVSDVNAINEAVDKVFAEFGDVDFLVNSAGVLRDFLISRFKEDFWDFTMEVNLKGVAVCSQAVATKWVNESRAKAKEAGVRKLPPTDNKPRVIVSISSQAAEGNIGQMAYSASKAGVVGMTWTMAKELCAYNIRAHAVKPTLIHTPIIGDLLERDEGKFEDFYKSKIPFGIGQPEYVSDPVCFLCSEGAFFMNGEIIGINGGKLGGL